MKISALGWMFRLQRYITAPNMSQSLSSVLQSRLYNSESASFVSLYKIQEYTWSWKNTTRWLSCHTSSMRRSTDVKKNYVLHKGITYLQCTNMFSIYDKLQQNNHMARRSIVSRVQYDCKTLTAQSYRLTRGITPCTHRKISNKREIYCSVNSVICWRGFSLCRCRQSSLSPVSYWDPEVRSTWEKMC